MQRPHSFQGFTYIEWEWSTRLALHRCDRGNHCATGHDRAVHLHPLIRGWGRRLPRPHLTRLQVGKLKHTIQVTTQTTCKWKQETRGRNSSKSGDIKGKHAIENELFGSYVSSQWSGHYIFGHEFKCTLSFGVLLHKIKRHQHLTK